MIIMNKFHNLRSMINIQKYVLQSTSVCGIFQKEYSTQERKFSSPANNSKKSLLFINSQIFDKSYKHGIISLKGQQFTLGSSMRFMSTSPPVEVIDITSNTGNTLQSALDQLSINSVVQDAPITSLNLASNWSPIGWCLHYLDFLHSIFPWWGAIVAGTIVLRFATFPLAIISQRYSAQMADLLPQQAILKEKMNRARATGDSLEFARLAQESHSLFKSNNVNPFKAMLAPLSQFPVFLTFFLSLRRCCAYPIESMTNGGISWIGDLTIPDPLYVLPLLTTLTLWITLESSFRSGMNPNQTPIFKYGGRIISLATLAFIYDFPAAILTYWCTNNIISLAQVFALRNPAVRNFLNIPQIKVKTQELDVNKKSFKTHFKETIENAKINKLLEERKTIDDINFKKSGIGPLKKTFKENPIKS